MLKAPLTPSFKVPDRIIAIVLVLDFDNDSKNQFIDGLKIVFVLSIEYSSIFLSITVICLFDGQI